MQAVGTFEVKMTPQSEDKVEDSNLGRLSLEKDFQGDLVAKGKGEMLTAMTAVQGSAGYVAIERVTGTLRGQAGSFVLMHTGVMTRGVQQLTLIVVPDSGSGKLSGLSGRMTIEVIAGKHSYDLDYTLPLSASE